MACLRLHKMQLPPFLRAIIKAQGISKAESKRVIYHHLCTIVQEYRLYKICIESGPFAAHPTPPSLSLFPRIYHIPSAFLCSVQIPSAAERVSD